MRRSEKSGLLKLFAIYKGGYTMKNTYILSHIENGKTKDSSSHATMNGAMNVGYSLARRINPNLEIGTKWHGSKTIKTLYIYADEYLQITKEG